MQKLFAKFSISDAPQPTRKDPTTLPNKFRLIDPKTLSNDDVNSESNNNNNRESVHNLNRDLLNGLDTLEECQEKTGGEEENLKVTSQENSSPVKRQAENPVDENDGAVNDMPRTKKVRQLKRGLRLCSSITCYIEQVVY